MLSPGKCLAIRLRSHSWQWCLIGILTLTWSCALAERPRVLILFSNDRLLPANKEMEDGIRRAFTTDSGEPSADLFGEFLDAVRFPGPDFDATMERFLNDRHQSKPPAVCISIGPQALDFIMRRRDSLFPGIPVIFGAVTPPQLGALPSKHGLAGRPMDWSITPLLDRLPEIRPSIRKILIVTGVSEFDRKRREEATAQIQPFKNRYQFEFSDGEDPEGLMQRCASLPDDTIVFYVTYFATREGRTMVPREMAGRLATASRVPVVGVYDTYIGTGVLGGAVLPFDEEGSEIGKMARRVIEGEEVGEIGILPPGRPRLVFDDRAMKRHGWKRANLPANSELRFREPNLWEAHRTGVLIGSGALALQTALIVSLLAARSRQRLAENERRLSESRFTGVFEGSPVSISIIRQADGRIIDVNPAWERTTGVSRDRAVGQTHIDIGFVFEDSSAERYLEYLASGKPLRDFEQRLRMPSGAIRILSVSTELLNLRGETCYVAMAQDITDRLEMDDARQKLAHASRLGMLGELTASIAHEVNQPLGAILSNAEAAEILMASENPPLDEIRAILADIRTDDLRAGEVISQVRAMIARNEVRMMPLDPSELAKRVVSLIRHDCKRRGISFSCEITGNLPWINGEKVQLEQLLLNLLLNAMEAVVSQEPLEKHIHFAVDLTDDQRVGFSVADSGPGIPQEILPRIFDHFFSTKPSGMGLGLALSRSIAEAHAARLTAENKPDGGTVFRFVLPLCHES
jgi:PAS domain S-box-containing protein